MYKYTHGKGDKKLLKSFKTEISPTAEQKNKIDRTIGTCRFVYNFYLAHNREIYEQESRFVSGYDFSIWLNNNYIPNNPEFAWIKDTPADQIIDDRIPANQRPDIVRLSYSPQGSRILDINDT